MPSFWGKESMFSCPIPRLFSLPRAVLTTEFYERLALWWSLSVALKSTTKRQRPSKNPQRLLQLIQEISRLLAEKHSRLRRQKPMNRLRRGRLRSLNSSRPGAAHLWLRSTRLTDRLLDKSSEPSLKKHLVVRRGGCEDNSHANVSSPTKFRGLSYGPF
jgi:hypothetical protein